MGLLRREAFRTNLRVDLRLVGRGTNSIIPAISRSSHDSQTVAGVSRFKSVGEAGRDKRGGTDGMFTYLKVCYRKDNVPSRSSPQQIERRPSGYNDARS
jgi:hypothetical protein